ncbi:MAG: AAA family ATPase [Candidatus Sumerlaeota bacterium]|nr:AAA family ATPase [Candidatus Sumerlaeota bacterium]
MLTRVYIDNFRSLVNFDLHLQPLCLLLGENGTGKSSVFDCLYLLQKFILGEGKVDQYFTENDLTSWQTTPLQAFVLEMKTPEGLFLYELIVEHDRERKLRHIKREMLLLDNRALFKFEEGIARLYRDGFSAGPEYPFDCSLSGIGSIQPRPDNKNLTAFKKYISDIYICRIVPSLISTETRETAARPMIDMRNFASWYRYLSHERQPQVFDLTVALRKILPGFHSFRLQAAGKSYLLQAGFQIENNEQSLCYYDFDQLSDGQRTLMALYTLLYCLKNSDAILLLDEPENFLALQEIQPWLLALADACGDEITQAVIISHHPELVNYLAVESGIYFERESNLPTRIKEIGNSLTVEGLKPSEVIERGWNK